MSRAQSVVVSIAYEAVAICVIAAGIILGLALLFYLGRAGIL